MSPSPTTAARGARTGKRIGILGGSFNPAHSGHRHISLLALEILGLDQVWWMVSPQNPLKPAQGMESFDKRLEGAERIADHPQIEVTEIEAQLGTRYTVDTLEALKKRLPDDRFVWLMGADNLVQIPKWRHWQAIFALVPIAVFDRNSYDSKAMEGEAARHFAGACIPEDQASSLADRTPPAWVYLHTPQHPASASAIRHDRSD